MNPKFDQIINQISLNPLFLRLKNVVENVKGWHEQEAVYDHSLKTAKIAQEQILGNFIINVEAKEAFVSFLNEEIFGLKRKEILVLTALLHDCGKILVFKEGEAVSNLLITDSRGQTRCPGHEFYGGSIIVPEILKATQLDEWVKSQIVKLVTLHATFNNLAFFEARKDWQLKELVSDLKSLAEGLYIEALFNSYCDGYNAPAFSKGKEAIEKIFNSPELYIKRTYLIPELPSQG